MVLIINNFLMIIVISCFVFGRFSNGIKLNIKNITSKESETIESESESEQSLSNSNESNSKSSESSSMELDGFMILPTIIKNRNIKEFSNLNLHFDKITICSGHGHFGYSRPEQRRWQKKHQSCAGKFQSPIAIISNKAIPLTMPAIELVGYHNLLPGPLLIHNNGHSVSLGIPKLTKAEIENGDKHPYIFGGKLKNEYELEGLHFHWGDKNNRGSEHVINDIRYPMEMHIIHRNKKYNSVAEALQHADGLTVLGFFYQLKEQESPELINIVKNLTSIETYNQQIHLNITFSLSSLIEGIELDRFYTYKGSLTTPPCSEAVTWILFPDPLSVSIAQMVKFRQLSNAIEGSVLVDNYRSLQPIGNRRVFVRRVNEKNTKLSLIKNDLHYSKWDWLY